MSSARRALAAFDLEELEAEVREQHQDEDFAELQEALLQHQASAQLGIRPQLERDIAARAERKERRRRH